MSAEYIKGASFTGYGSTLIVGIGIPIPVIDEEMAYFTSRTDAELVAQVVDYSEDYPNRIPRRSARRAMRAQDGQDCNQRQRGSDIPISSYAKRA